MTLYSFLQYWLLAVATVSLAITLLIFAYHMLLAAVALWPKRSNQKEPPDRFRRFAIVIPAHNEESTIQIALDSCSTLDYPPDAFEVFVVADNCSDGTGTQACRYGAHLLTRVDKERRGKGYALDFAFNHILQEPYDAVVVLDADCRIEAHALRAANDCLYHGSKVVQLSYETSNCDASALSLLLGIANTLENHFYYAPKSRLGLFTVLRGTGMVISTEVLRAYPWNSYSIVEDSEYSYRLVMDGIRVTFLEDSAVTSEFPENRTQLTTQRKRWFGGGVKLAKSQSWQLLKDGLLRRDWHLADAALNSWIVARPVVIMQLLFSILLTVGCWLTSPDLVFGPSAVGLLCAIVFGYVSYAALGVLRLGMTAQRAGLLLRAPLIVGHYLRLSLDTLIRGGTNEWQTTPRTNSLESKQPPG